jgi:hypothetical protein
MRVEEFVSNLLFIGFEKVLLEWEKVYRKRQFDLFILY